MSDIHSPTVVDVAFEILSRSGEPLSPEQIAWFARRNGFDLNGWQIRNEIDAHLRFFGYRSPFIEIGRFQYTLLPALAPSRTFPGDFNSLRPVAAAVALLIVLMLTFIAIRLEWPATQVAKEVVAMPPAVEQEQTASFSADPGWWQAHAQNQINSRTFEVASQFLRNPYNTCGPAVVAMLASYYQAQGEDRGNPVVTAEVLRDAKNQLGYYQPPYNSGLLTFDHLREILGLYGVRQSFPKGSESILSFQALMERVRQRTPAIAGMRYGYAEGGRYLPAGGRGLYNHFVIVFNASEEGGQEYLWVLNPHPGKYLTHDSDTVPVKMSVEEFQGSWMLNNGSEWADWGHAAFYEFGN
jgi:hypothetical protein